VEGEDYVLVPKQVWKRLVEWYSGGPPIERKLICQGFYTRSYSVEVYPLCLMLTDGRDESRTVIRLGKQVLGGPDHTTQALCFATTYLWCLCIANESLCLNC
jgi:hypothetical protein